MSELDIYANNDDTGDEYADGTPIVDDTPTFTLIPGLLADGDETEIDAAVEELMGILQGDTQKSATKFNSYHDRSGRFGSGSMAGLVNAVAKTGGFSYRPGEKSPTSGMVLSIHPERSHIVDVKDLKGSDIRTFINKNKDLLKEKTNYIGAWHDTATGKVFLDVSTIVPTHHEAVALSKQYGQRAYFDLSTGTEVRVLDESQAHQAANAPAPQEQKANKDTVTLQTLHSDATDEECNALVDAIQKRQAEYDAKS